LISFKDLFLSTKVRRNARDGSFVFHVDYLYVQGVHRTVNPFHSPFSHKISLWTSMSQLSILDRECSLYTWNWAAGKLSHGHEVGLHICVLLNRCIPTTGGFHWSPFITLHMIFSYQKNRDKNICLLYSTEFSKDKIILIVWHFQEWEGY
jgi:hypothetical protein